MSIELTGPEKFSFQDAVCALLALEFIETASALIIEPANGEDAELVFESGETRNIVEVQVKGAAGTVTLGALARFLAHFPPRRSDGCLFDRIISDPKRSALFIASGRCGDDLQRFVVDAYQKPIHHREGKIRKKDAEALLSEFKRTNAKRGTGLYEARRRECLRITREVSQAAVRRVAERVLISERVTAAEIKSRCIAKLRDKYKVPSDRLDDALGCLRANVEQAKQNRADVLLLVKDTLKQFAVPPIRPADYVARDCESDWIKRASHDRVLLLSGPPRCGKSFAARCVGGHFQDLGFEVCQGRDVDEAYRFLSEPSHIERLYILDDPLGGVRIDAEASRSLGTLRSLVTSLLPTRRLIVSQNQQQLFSLTGTQELRQCPIGPYSWFDLGSPGSDFLSAAWKQMTQGPAVPDRKSTRLNSSH